MQCSQGSWLVYSAMKEKPSFNISYPFSLDVKRGDNFGVWRYLHMCLQVMVTKCQSGYRHVQKGRLLAL